MTILSSKKKGSSVKKSNDIDSGDHGGPLSHSLPLPHDQLQESLNIGTERLYVAERSTGPSLWPHTHGQNLSHHGLNLNPAREDKRTSQTHYEDYEHIESSSAHHGKRRHRVSPMRSTRSKISRVDRERGNASPNSSSTSVNCTPTTDASSNKCKLASSTCSDAYNSEDEYESRSCQLTEEEWSERERRFEKKMRKKGFIIKKMGEDGACLFRAVADQVYGDQEMHTMVRDHCMDYIAKNEDYFSQYVTEDFSNYVNRKRLDYVHGNHIEIQAMTEIYNRSIEVYCYSTEPINIFHGAQQTDNAPIRLSYHRGVHYNSVVDPYKATVGVGLGLPGHIPGLADKNIIKEATRQSEEVHIEQAMLEDKLLATDWEATNEAIEEQVSRESYLQWLKDNERRNRTARSPTACSSSTSTTSTAPVGEIRSPRPRSHGAANISPIGSPFRGEGFRNSPPRLSPPPSTPGTSKTMSSSHPSTLTPPAPNLTPETSQPALQLLETATLMNQLPPEMFGMSEWEDAGILAQVLAESQQEYLDSLKRPTRESGAHSPNNSHPIQPDNVNSK